jgi:hypothetical protein
MSATVPSANLQVWNTSSTSSSSHHAITSAIWWSLLIPGSIAAYTGTSGGPGPAGVCTLGRSRSCDDVTVVAPLVIDQPREMHPPAALARRELQRILREALQEPRAARVAQVRVVVDVAEHHTALLIPARLVVRRQLVVGEAQPEQRRQRPPHLPVPVHEAAKRLLIPLAARLPRRLLIEMRPIQIRARERIEIHVVRQKSHHEPSANCSFRARLSNARSKLPFHNAAAATASELRQDHPIKPLIQIRADHPDDTPPARTPAACTAATTAARSSNGNVWIALSAKPPCDFPERFPATNAPYGVSIS